FDEEWYTSHCSQKCECEEEDGMGEIECDDEDGCDENAVCLPNQDGDYYCQSTGFGECTITRASEYTTFDSLKYNFNGEHSYVLVKSKNLPPYLQDVYVEGITTRIHDGSDSSEEENSHRSSEEDDDKEEDSDEQGGHHRLHELKIRVYNHTVEFKNKLRVVVDGRHVIPPVSPSAGLKIYKRFLHVYLKSDFGLLVRFNKYGATEIILPHVYRRKLGGMCGNFDQQRQNDWMKPDGTLARNVR
uniref:VWFD domain-containing protein n=1 Tax=Tetraodon nigroviridis TaxID=99883 RepID=H3DCU4_TETNG